jgi:magnesium and cobalt exporter, CNNM family
VSAALDALVLLVLLAGSATFAGSETGFYALSRVRVELAARQGRRVARLIRWLLRDETALLITLLIGNNLVAQLATFKAEDLVRVTAVPEVAREIVVTAVLGPLLFFFGEVLPKDLFRRRPHALLGLTAPFIALCRVLFWPVERLLWLTTAGLARLFGQEPRLITELRGREAVLRLLEEGAETGAIEPHAEVLARNVLQLRTTRVADCMVPWAAVATLPAERPDEELRSLVRESAHTRLPVVGAGGVQGYVHQLDVLGGADGRAVLESVRPALAVSASTAVDRALARLRAGGQRMAVVGTLAEPVGLVTLKDLLEEISGDLSDW